MVVLSVLRKFPSQRTIFNGQLGVHLRNQTRSSGHDHRFVIHPSDWSWKKYKDIFNLYFLVAAIPLGLFSTYCNIVFGPAVLSETPEGYVPKNYEYERSPVTRRFMRWMHEPQDSYEQTIHILNREQETVMLLKMEDRVKNLMNMRNDYQAWYYAPHFAAKEYRIARDFFLNLIHKGGFSEYDTTPAEGFPNEDAVFDK